MVNQVCHVELGTAELTADAKEGLQVEINRLIRENLPVVTTVFPGKDDPGLSSAHTRGTSTFLKNYSFILKVTFI